MTVKGVLYVFCIAAACLAWHVQESNAAVHSPRRLVIGRVTTVHTNRHRGGSIDDSFQLQLQDGSPSPSFSTDTLAESQADQPIHIGDVLGVLYRTRDDVPLSIDELRGQRAGWHYHRSDNGNAYVFAVSVVGFAALAGALFNARKVRRSASSSATE